MNAWTDKLTRVVRELLVALIRRDMYAARRTFWRVAGRLGIRRPSGPHGEIYRMTVAFGGALALSAFWALFALLALSGGWE